MVGKPPEDKDPKLNCLQLLKQVVTCPTAESMGLSSPCDADASSGSPGSTEADAAGGVSSCTFPTLSMVDSFTWRRLMVSKMGVVGVMGEQAPSCSSPLCFVDPSKPEFCVTSGCVELVEPPLLSVPGS